MEQRQERNEQQGNAEQPSKKQQFTIDHQIDPYEPERHDGGAFRRDVPGVIAEMDDVVINRILDSRCIEDS